MIYFNKILKNITITLLWGKKFQKTPPKQKYKINTLKKINDNKKYTLTINNLGV